MPYHLVFMLTALAHATAPDYVPLGDAAHPNCAARTCVVKNGGRVFDVTMEAEDKKELTYLRRVRIKARDGSADQEFATPSVNAAENHEPFKIYAVKLRPKFTDLALLAFDSAQAGPTYYYYLYDPKTREFVASESTVPKLVHDSKSKALKSELQGVEFKIDDLQLKEK